MIGDILECDSDRYKLKGLLVLIRASFPSGCCVAPLSPDRKGVGRKSEHTGVGNLIRKGWKLERRGGKKQKVESGV